MLDKSNRKADNQPLKWTTLSHFICWILQKLQQVLTFLGQLLPFLLEKFSGHIRRVIYSCLALVYWQLAQLYSLKHTIQHYVEIYFSPLVQDKLLKIIITAPGWITEKKLLFVCNSSTHELPMGHTTVYTIAIEKIDNFATNDANIWYQLNSLLH